MVTGKGGVGKSFLCALLAYEAVRAGKKVCIVESQSEDQMGPLLGIGAVGHCLTPVGPRLSVINLDPHRNFQDFISLHLGFPSLVDKVFSKSIVKSFVEMIPGIAEVTLLGRLYYYAELEEEHKFDLIILDGFATGHFLSLLATPDAILNAGFVGPVVKETQKVKDFISDPTRCGSVLVTGSEDLMISESLEFMDKFKSTGHVALDAVFVNRVLRVPDVDFEGDTSLCRIVRSLRDSSNRAARQIQNFGKELQRKGPLQFDELHLIPELFTVPEPVTEDSNLRLGVNIERWPL